MCFVLCLYYSLVYSLAGELSLTLHCSVTRLTTAESGTTVLSIHWLATPTTCTWLWTWGSSSWTSPYAEGLNRCLRSSPSACKPCPLSDCSVTEWTSPYAEGLNHCLQSSLLACKLCPLSDCSVTEWTSPYTEGLNHCLQSSLLACKLCPLSDCSVTAVSCAHAVCRCQFVVQGRHGPFLLS